MTRPLNSRNKQHVTIRNNAKKANRIHADFMHNWRAMGRPSHVFMTSVTRICQISPCRRKSAWVFVYADHIIDACDGCKGEYYREVK